MTIKEFAKEKNKKEKLVVSWIRKDLIPRASVDNNFIPASARIPYTKARAKTAKGRYISMVKATERFYHIIPKLYGICKDEFDAYIQRLVDAGLIVRRLTDGIEYYDRVFDSNSKKSFIVKAIEVASRGVTEGITNAIIKNTK